MWHQISGGSRGRAWPGPPLFLDQTEAWRTDKNFFLRLGPPPLSQGQDDCPLPLYLKVWICHCRLSWWQNFWNLTIFLDRDSHLHCQTMEKIHGLPFGSWVQSCSYLSFFFFFAIPRLVEVQCGNVISRRLHYSGLIIPNLLCWTSPRWHAECNGKQKNLTIEADDCWSEHTQKIRDAPLT